MMTDKADAVVLSELTSAQIYGLFDALAELPGSWARLAGTDPGLLGQGNQRALAALRAAFAHSHGVLLGELAKIGLPLILSALDASEGEEEVTDFAMAAGRVLGPVAAPVFLAAVASGSDPFAREVSERLTELRGIATRAGAVASDAASPGGAATAASSPLTSPLGPAEDSGATGGGALPPATFTALTARTEDLVRRGAALVDQIARCAERSGSIPNYWPTRLTLWSKRTDRS